MQRHHVTAHEWDALAADPEFQALLRARRRFVLPATVFFFLFYFSLPAGVALAPALMRRPVFGPLTFAYALGLLEFAMVWVLLALYMHQAKAFDSRAATIAQRARASLSK